MTRTAVAAAKASQPPAHATPARPSLQMKAVIGPVDDPLEHEADRIAEAVIGGSAPGAISPAAPATTRMKCAECEAEEKEHGIQRTCAHCAAEQAATSNEGDAAEQAAAAVSQGGAPLSPVERSYFEPRFGRDLSSVRVHSDAGASSAARAINARAFALGPNIAFAPGERSHATTEGRRLMAHEIAHVVQQTAPGSVMRQPVIRRDETAPDPAPAPEQVDGPATDEPADATKSATKPDTTLVYGRVTHIYISCATGKMIYKTTQATYVYQLTSCDRSFPAGDYTADVAVLDNGKSVRLTFPQAQAGGHIFDSKYRIARGQPSPDHLLKDQDKVDVTFGGGPLVIPDVRPECLISFPAQELFKGGGDTKDLSHLIPKIPTFEWEIAEFGLADVSLRFAITASAKAGYSYKPGMLKDICLSRLTSKGMVGRGTFAFSGQVDLHLDVTAGIEVPVRVLKLIEILTPHGELTLDIDAALGGEVEAMVEIWLDPKQKFHLNTDVEFAALTALAAKLSGSAGLDVLGFSLWRGSIPSILEGGLNYGWTGGMRFGDDFLPAPEMGTLAKATPKQLSAGALRTQAARRPARKKDDSLPIGDLVKSWVHDSSGTLERDGLTKDKALPLHWFKPKSLYPKEISFGAPGVFPASVGRDDGPKKVSHPDVSTLRWRGRAPEPGPPITGPSPIGVNSSNWPESGGWAKGFQYIPGTSSRDESDTFRQLMRGLGARYDNLSATDGRVQMDHVRDLQFGGKDRFDNIWPFDASANGSAGPLQQKQIEAYSKLFKDGIAGRWFMISNIGLDPGPLPKPTTP